MAEFEWCQECGRSGWVTEGEPLLTPKQVAETLAISPRGVRRLAERGDIVAFRVGQKHLRIAPSDLAAYLERQRLKEDQG